MQGVNITFDDYYYIKAWIGYLDITFSDMILFAVFISLIVLGIYVFIKKNIFLGLLQVMLTMFTPLVIGGFFVSYKPFWGMETKMWVKFLVNSNVNNSAARELGLLIFIVVPAFVIVTIKNLTLLMKSENLI